MPSGQPWPPTTPSSSSAESGTFRRIRWCGLRVRHHDSYEQSSQRGTEEDGDSRNAANAVRGTARSSHAHRVQPRHDAMGQPRRAVGDRRRGAVRGRNLDPGCGQRRLSLRRLAERRGAGGRGRLVLRGPVARLHRQGARQRRGRGSASRVRGGRPGGVRRSRAGDDLPHAAGRGARNRRRQRARDRRRGRPARLHCRERRGLRNLRDATRSPDRPLRRGARGAPGLGRLHRGGPPRRRAHRHGDGLRERRGGQSAVGRHGARRAHAPASARSSRWR